MARKKLHAVRAGRCLITIYKDSYAGEFVVTTDINGKREGGKAGGGYFTDSKSDARSTAAATIKQLRRQGRC